jgi:parallel beta-helix repeat protein
MGRCSDGWQRIWQAMAIAVWLGASPTPSSADCTYFVRAGAEPSDGLPKGRSPEAAFATITEGAQALLNSGDVLCVGPGRYAEGNITIPIDGVPSSPVEIRADPTGRSTDDPPGPVEVVPPTGTGADLVTVAFLVRGRRDLVIEGFTISGFRDAGIQVRAAAVSGTPSMAVTLRGNQISACGRGIDVIARDLIVVEGNGTVGNNGSGISIEACLFATPEGRCEFSSGAPVTPVVSNNRSGGNRGAGIFLDEANDAIIQNNVVYSNDSSGIVLQECNDAQVINNLVYANEEHGLSVGKVVASPRPLVLNNTFYGNGSWGIEIGTPTAGSPAASVVNNIVVGNFGGGKGIGVLNENSGLTPVRPASTCGYFAGFNLVSDAYGPDTPFNAYDINADPLFVAPGGPDALIGGAGSGSTFIDHSADDDFHLRQLGDEGALSPAVDAGSAPVAELGLSGSTASDGRRDRDRIDIGFHYDADPDQEITFAKPFMPIYVRDEGGIFSDGVGLTESTAFATIGAAAQHAAAGITVVVGPGRYRECNLQPPRNHGLATFLADPNGEHIPEVPNPVVIDASRCDAGDTGFSISSACGVVVDGFHVTGATEDGIRVYDDCDGAELRHNVAFQNGKHGIEVINSADVRVFNNLAFENAKGGIAVGSRLRTGPTPAGSRRAVVEFNTAWGNAFNGIQIGDGTGISSHATVRYNVTGENGGNGIEVGDDERRPENLRGYETKYNLVGDSYGAGVPRNVGDLLLNLSNEPVYVDPSQIDTSGEWPNDDHFRLVQTAAGQPDQSRAVDHGDVSAVEAGLADRSTRSDGIADDGVVDIGYHYPSPTALVGDCNGDGRVRINELVLAVNIALGLEPMSACQAIDADRDGRPAVDELVRAVRNGLGG